MIFIVKQQKLAAMPEPVPLLDSFAIVGASTATRQSNGIDQGSGDRRGNHHADQQFGQGSIADKEGNSQSNGPKNHELRPIAVCAKKTCEFFECLDIM